LLWSNLTYAKAPGEALAELDQLKIPFNEQNFFTYSQSGNEYIVTLFLDAGINVNIRNPFGWTPLMAASGGNQRQIVKVLLDHGADVNMTTPQNETALYYAATMASQEVVSDLLAAGASKNIKSTFGFTPADMAKNMGRKDIVALINNWGKQNQITTQSIDSKTTLILINEENLKLAEKESHSLNPKKEWYETLPYFLGSKKYSSFDHVGLVNFYAITPYSTARYMYAKTAYRLLDVKNEYIQSLQSMNGFVYIYTGSPLITQPPTINVVIKKNDIIHKHLNDSSALPYILTECGIGSAKTWIFPAELFVAGEDIELIAIDAKDGKYSFKIPGSEMSKIK
jgi:hypothetical protein